MKKEANFERPSEAEERLLKAILKILRESGSLEAKI